MRDWACRIETRNYSIKRRTDQRNLCELLTITASVVLLAGVFGFYAWVRCGIRDLGYQEQFLTTHEESLLRDQKNLILEEQTLKNPQRIEFIAQTELGMVRVHTNQLMAPALQSIDLDGTARLALAAAPASPPGSRKPSASN